MDFPMAFFSGSGPPPGDPIDLRREGPKAEPREGLPELASSQVLAAHATLNRPAHPRPPTPLLDLTSGTKRTSVSEDTAKASCRCWVLLFRADLTTKVHLQAVRAALEIGCRWPTSSNLGRIWPDRGQKYGHDWPNFVELGPNLDSRSSPGPLAKIWVTETCLPYSAPTRAHFQRYLYDPPWEGGRTSR